MSRDHTLDLLLSDTRSGASLYQRAAQHLDDPALSALLLDLQERHQRIGEALAIKRDAGAGPGEVQTSDRGKGLLESFEDLRLRLSGEDRQAWLERLARYEAHLINAYEEAGAEADAGLQALLGVELPKLRQCLRELRAAGAGD